jgi:hypothetical protein
MKQMQFLAATALILAAPSALHAGVVITPSAGFNITWNGNDGALFNQAAVAPVPSNLANAAGAAAFASSDLGPQIGVPFHVTANLNDGRYGNANSWIGGDGPATPFAGISLGGLYNVTSFAFGRDNGNGAFDDSFPGTDAGGGQLDDRYLGVYTLQYTAVANPAGAAVTGSSATGWQTVGTFNYQSSDDAVPGGAFTGWFRHEYGLSGPGGALQSPRARHRHRRAGHGD